MLRSLKDGCKPSTHLPNRLYATHSNHFVSALKGSSKNHTATHPSKNGLPIVGRPPLARLFVDMSLAPNIPITFGPLLSSRPSGCGERFLEPGVLVGGMVDNLADTITQYKSCQFKLRVRCRRQQNIQRLARSSKSFIPRL